MHASITAGLAAQGATAIRDAFDLYQRAFRQITHCAKGHFATRDWHAAERDSVERLDLYRRVIDRIVSETREALAGHMRDKGIWTGMRAAYSDLVAGRDDMELAESFFNSVTRRIFATVGVDPGIEFVDSDFAIAPNPAQPIYRTYPRRGDTAALIAEILRSYPFPIGYADLAGDARLVAAEVDAYLRTTWGSPELDTVEMVAAVFYRNKGAYLVGRIRRDGRVKPLILALLNAEAGVTVDAVLLTEDEASNTFSYTRSYFQVEIESAYLLVDFLSSIMPWKRRAELYTSIGYNKHGKTELYRDLYCHLQGSEDRFELARGDRGMVMVVFTMPSFDYVFKVIKDAFPYPKRTTRADVLSRYQLVFKRDRAGRLVDAQEFEHLAFDRARFTDEALDELLSQCGTTVSLIGDTVDIKHLYTERRMIPLNLYLRESEPEAAAAAVLDYGQAIRDLAATNIFPGRPVHEELRRDPPRPRGVLRL